MKTYLFINPASGHHTEQRRAAVLERLQACSMTPELLEVRTPAEIFSYCALINTEQESPLVIVAGGDGTFNAVINGLEPGRATLAVLPFGTSNVLAAELGITSIEDALERIAAGKTSILNVGLIELEERSLRFVLMAGIGLDGTVVRDVWPLAKKLLRQGAYALSALKRAILWSTERFGISTPDTDITCHTAIICNAARYGGNFILSPGSSLFTPGLSAVCITGNQRRAYLKNAWDLFRGRAGINGDLLRIRSSMFEVKGRHPIQVDGDFVGYGPARITELVGFARIIV